MLSGKAILAIGKAQIAAIKWLWVRYRRRVIESRFPYEDQDEIKGLDEMCDDLVDFCRCVVPGNTEITLTSAYIQGRRL